jgi:hypothetical protein
MQKKRTQVALRTQSHQTVSPASQKSGLIAKPKKLTQSVRTKSALDNLSHRTNRTNAKTNRIILERAGINALA